MTVLNVCDITLYNTCLNAVYNQREAIESRYGGIEKFLPTELVEAVTNYRFTHARIAVIVNVTQESSNPEWKVLGIFTNINCMGTNVLDFHKIFASTLSPKLNIVIESEPLIWGSSLPISIAKEQPLAFSKICDLATIELVNFPVIKIINGVVHRSMTARYRSSETTYGNYIVPHLKQSGKNYSLSVEQWESILEKVFFAKKTNS